MTTSFPTDPEDRKALVRRMNELAPDLMADINTLRKTFPHAKVTYFKAGDLEVGIEPPEMKTPAHVPPPKAQVDDPVKTELAFRKKLQDERARAKRRR